MIAWLHDVLGAPPPPLEGRIVVPGSELREAQRKLRKLSSGSMLDQVRGAGGNIVSFPINIQAATK